MIKRFLQDWLDAEENYECLEAERATMADAGKCVVCLTETTNEAIAFKQGDNRPKRYAIICANCRSIIAWSWFAW